MIILAIETSCDDTAISIVKATSKISSAKFKVLAHLVSSQTALHAEFGGVVPSLAKREHAKNLTPLLITALKKAQLFKPALKPITYNLKPFAKILAREPELYTALAELLPSLTIPKIDAIAVTSGPGLEPALWVGINFAKALALAWNKPLMPVNHMTGHIYSVLIDNPSKLKFPAIALLVSGGHTELVLIKDWLSHKIIGQTRDDAVGEAFDKVARILGLPYPGGPEISRLAEKASPDTSIKLPRPMISSKDFDFSFSGLKTAVLYLVKRLEADNKLTEKVKQQIAHEFQQAAIDVLIAKTLEALQKYHAKSLIVGGGVIANKELRRQLSKALNPKTYNLLTAPLKVATDNATMIATAGYLYFLNGKKLPPLASIKARGNAIF